MRQYVYIVDCLSSLLARRVLRDLTNSSPSRIGCVYFYMTLAARDGDRICRDPLLCAPTPHTAHSSPPLSPPASSAHTISSPSPPPLFPHCAPLYRPSRTSLYPSSLSLLALLSLSPSPRLSLSPLCPRSLSLPPLSSFCGQIFRIHMKLMISLIAAIVARPRSLARSFLS